MNEAGRNEATLSRLLDDPNGGDPDFARGPEDYDAPREREEYPDILTWPAIDGFFTALPGTLFRRPGVTVSPLCFTPTSVVSIDVDRFRAARTATAAVAGSKDPVDGVFVTTDGSVHLFRARFQWGFLSAVTSVEALEAAP